MNAARRDRHRAGERRAALAADQIAAEIFHRQSTLVRHRGQLQNVDRLSIRLVREGVEQHVQIVDRRHRVVVLRQRHDRDARDLDCVAQTQRVAVFEVDRPDDVALPLLELLGVIARDGLDRRVGGCRDACLIDLQKSDAIARRGRHLVVIHKGEKFILLVHAAAIVDKNAGARHLAAHLILADLYGEKRLAEKRRASLRFKAQRQMECLPVRFVGELRALRVDDLSSVGKSNRR